MRPLLLLAVLLAMGVGATAARCYPPGTRVVVFIEGVYTSYGGADSGTDFDRLKEKFVAAGYAPEKLLHFSYAGGSFDADGAWEPNPYRCAMTDRRANENLQYLEKLLLEYRERHPDAHFTLVGHSLGGYLAYLEGVRDAARPPDERLQVDAVVTLDAPLNGLGAEKKLVIDLVACTKTYLAGAEIVADGVDPDLSARRQAEVASLREAGIKLATLGNQRDCLYGAVGCTDRLLVTEVESQVIEGADLAKLYSINAEPFTSHFLVMWHPVVMADVVAFAGAP